jgi:hypothetical protein
MSTLETRDTRNLPLLERREEAAARDMAGGSAFESVAAVATMVLAIVGLAGGWPLTLASIAGIVLGAALLLRGGAVACRFTRLLSEVPMNWLSDAELGGGMSTHIVGGAAGLVLCVLAMLRLAPAILLPIAAAVFGATLLLGAGTLSSLNAAVIERSYAGHEASRRLAGAMSSGALAAQVMVGLAAIVLGVIGLVGYYPLLLMLVALLCLGATVALSSAAVSARTFRALRH